MTPKADERPALTAPQRKRLDDTHFDPREQSCAFQNWILRYGPPLAAHAILFEEAARVVAGETLGEQDRASAVRAFEREFKGDASQKDYFGFDYFFACSVTALKQRLYVPACAAACLGSDTGLEKSRILFMDHDPF